MVKFSIILLLLFLFSFLVKIDYSFDQDLGRHIKFGEIIWQTKSVPNTNLFSYTYPDFPFINHHWLFELVSYLLSKTFGVQILFWLKITLLLTTCYLLLITISKKSCWLMLPLGFIFFHILRERTDFRPELFSFLFTALTIFILEKYQQYKTKLIYLLPLIQLIWVNMHIYFLIGLIIQGIYCLNWFFKVRKERPWMLDKPLILVLLLSATVTLVNPNFIIGALYPLKVFGNYGYTIAENQNFFLLENIGFKDQNILFVKLALFLTLMAWVYGFLHKTLTFINFGLSAVGFALALANIRSFPYLVLLSLPAVLNMLAPLDRYRWIKAINYLVVVLLLLESYLYLNNSYYLYTDSQTRLGIGFGQNYQKGLDFLISKNLPQPIFNNFDLGSYIEYKDFPGYKIFVDGRPEGYPADFFQKVYIPMQEKPEVFQENLKKYGFKTVIFSITDQTPWAASFFVNLTKNPDWKIVYLDDRMVIFISSSTQSSLPAIDLNQQTPQLISSEDNMAYLRLAIFLYNTGHLKKAYDFTQKSLSLFPYSPLANKLIIAILQASGDSYGVFGSNQYYQNSSNLYFW